MPHFFIERPIFAWVVALFIVLTGILSMAAPAGCAISYRRTAAILFRSAIRGQPM
ncbi:MAG: hypothetical protein ACLR17_01850 [Enterobacteriaceae bacterium]